MVFGNRRVPMASKEDDPKSFWQSRKIKKLWNFPPEVFSLYVLGLRLSRLLVQFRQKKKTLYEM